MTLTEMVQVALVAVGGTAVAATAAGVLAKILIEHGLKKDFKKFESAVDARFKEDLKTFESIVDAQFKKEQKVFEGTFDHRLAKEMKSFEANIAANVKLVEMKLPVYKKLWELSSDFRSSQPGPYSDEYLKAAEKKLLDWYYQDGSGAVLSFDAQSRLQAGLQLLRSGPNHNPEEIRNVFSGLRTQLKRDLGIYSAEQAANPLPISTVIAEARAMSHKIPKRE